MYAQHLSIFQLQLFFGKFYLHVLPHPSHIQGWQCLMLRVYSIFASVQSLEHSLLNWNGGWAGDDEKHYWRSQKWLFRLINQKTQDNFEVLRGSEAGLAFLCWVSKIKTSNLLTPCANLCLYKSQIRPKLKSLSYLGRIIFFVLLKDPNHYIAWGSYI